jgi:hypothetical protein
MDNLEIEDYHDILNAVGVANPPIPVVHSSKVSFDTRWVATGGLTSLTDTSGDVHFTGEFRQARATIAWSAREPSQHFEFVADPDSPAAPQTNPNPAVIGRERNGVFFP